MLASSDVWYTKKDRVRSLAVTVPFFDVGTYTRFIVFGRCDFFYRLTEKVKVCNNIHPYIAKLLFTCSYV